LIERHKPGRVAAFHSRFRADLVYFVQHDRKLALRVLQMVEAVAREPFEGIGRPEPLKYLGPDIWSRRVTEEHRLVYRVLDERVDFLQARYHY
jgi:toxin YoeB